MFSEITSKLSPKHGGASHAEVSGDSKYKGLASGTSGPRGLTHGIWHLLIQICDIIKSCLPLPPIASHEQHFLVPTTMHYFTDLGTCNRKLHWAKSLYHHARSLCPRGSQQNFHGISAPAVSSHMHLSSSASPPHLLWHPWSID